MKTSGWMRMREWNDLFCIRRKRQRKIGIRGESGGILCVAEAGKKPASGGHRALELSDGPAETAAGCREKSGGLLYAATMRNDSPEAAARIRKHQEQRRGKGVPAV